jgi:uncharacterized repeat protein (TIGR04138 family)
VSNKENFVEFATSYLKSINSKYTLESIILTTTILDNILQQNSSKISTLDIVYLAPSLILKEYGYLWDIILSKCKIETWEDFGNIIFISVELGILKKTDEDRLEDFTEAEKRVPLLDDCSLLESEGYITTHIRKKT